MPKRTRKRLDPVQNAYRVVQESVGNTEGFSRSVVSQVMSAMGRKGGKIGGKRRLVTMTPERRKEVARQAAQTRWKNAKKTKKSA